MNKLSQVLDLSLHQKNFRLANIKDTFNATFFATNGENNKKCRQGTSSTTEKEIVMVRTYTFSVGSIGKLHYTIRVDNKDLKRH